MPCYSPIKAYRTKNGISFKEFDDDNLYNIDLPCGQCVGCRLEYARQWSIRIMHEASLHDSNCFLTLTLDDDHLNSKKSLDKNDFRLFMVRLRKWIKRENKKHKRCVYGKVGYYMCGEYGENLLRPHYHCCLFNFDFPDKLRVDDSKSGCPQFKSEILDKIWGLGIATIGELSIASASYCAGYVSKKVRSHSSDYYGDRLPEYTSCSTRPAVGLLWIKKYYNDVYNNDIIVSDEKISRPPRYYDKYLEKTYPERFLDLKSRREQNAHVNCNEYEKSDLRVYAKHKHALINSRRFAKRDLADHFDDSPAPVSQAQKNHDEKVIKYKEEILGQ